MRAEKIACPMGIVLRIEEIEGDPEAIKAALDEACHIPRPISVPIGHAMVKP